MSVARVAAAVPSLARELERIDPEHAKEYRARGQRYVERLDALNTEIEHRVKSVPTDARRLVTLHDSLAYFADQYGFELAATVFAPAGAGAQASAAQLDRVERIVDSEGVKTVFAEVGQNPDALEQIARATGAKVQTLAIAAPLPGSTYEDMMREDAKKIVAGLE